MKARVSPTYFYDRCPSCHKLETYLFPGLGDQLIICQLAYHEIKVSNCRK